MVAQAKARNAISVKNGRVELRHGSVDDLPFASDTFHKAIAINSMQIWSDAIAGLREMRRAKFGSPEWQAAYAKGDTQTDRCLQENRSCQAQCANP